MTPVAFIIDTSYLLELFKVPDCSNESHGEKIKEKYYHAIENKSRLYVPLSCVFEFADHIADVKNGNSRKILGGKFLKTIKSSIEDQVPWTITPSAGLEFIPKICEVFANTYVIRGIGLTDTSIISEAKRLKKKYKSFYKVHIWTKDKKLKAYEPDKEKNPFTG